MPQTLRHWLAQDPYTLSLSSGFFGFFAHCGVVAVLEEERLLPQSLSGASAGAIIAGAWAAGLGAGEIRESLFALSREDFWDPGWGLGFLRGERFLAKLRSLLPVEQFAQCRRPVAISVYNLTDMQTQVLDQGDLALAIRASCSVPLMFAPVKIDGKYLVDGGLRDHTSLAGVSRRKRILCHHLLAKSGELYPRVRRQSQLVTMVIRQLPSVGPFRLEAGRSAYKIAYDATKRALDMQLVDNYH